MFIGRCNFLFHSLVCNLIMSSVMWNILVRYSSVHHGLGDSSCKRTVEPIYGLSLAPRGQHHVALTSMMWSSLAGSTRTCCMWLWLNTSPGPNESSRGMAIPFCWCSLLPTECTLPRLRMLAVSIWSSSRDKLSFSMQLSEDIEQKFQFQVSSVVGMQFPSPPLKKKASKLQLPGGAYQGLADYRPLQCGAGTSEHWSWGRGGVRQTEASPQSAAFD